LTAKAKRQSKLPINLEDLMRQRHVEGERIEYKAGWNPDPKGEGVNDGIIRTLFAFANDLTVLDKPPSKNQKYRRTQLGERWLKELAP
jgi:hypothetical protein